MMHEVKPGDTLILGDGTHYRVTRINRTEPAMYPYSIYDDHSSIPVDNYTDGGLSESGIPHSVIGVVGTGIDVDSAAAREGIKYDQGKPDYSLLTRPMVESMIGALMHGEGKYGRGNFRNGFTNTRLVAAAMRHLMAYLDGEDNDPESGVSHLGHAQAAVAMLCDNIASGVCTEGRYERPK